MISKSYILEKNINQILSKSYDADLIISEHSLVDGYEYEFLDEVTVKGKSEPVKIYTIRK